MAMTYEDCLERMGSYLAQADSTGSEFDRELYLTLRAATSQAFELSEDVVDSDVRSCFCGRAGSRRSGRFRIAYTQQPRECWVKLKGK